jgi:CheY-like chemotaxis protein
MAGQTDHSNWPCRMPTAFWIVRTLHWNDQTSFKFRGVEADMIDDRNEWISKRAYALWEEHGRTDGHDHEHWLRASVERDLMEATRASIDGREVITRRQRYLVPQVSLQASSAREGKVLVVDDEPEIRFNTVSTLEDAGYMAIEAANASEALLWLRKHDVNAVVTDINMPGVIDGLGLAERIRSLWPKTKVIITSGLVRLRSSDLGEDVIFLTKPFHDQTLLDALKR